MKYCVVNLVVLCLLSLYEISDSRYLSGKGSLSIGNLFRRFDKSICGAIKAKENLQKGLEDVLLDMAALNGVMKDLKKILKKKPINMKKEPLPLVQALLSRNRPQYLKLKFEEQEIKKKFEWTDEQLREFWKLYSETEKIRTHLRNMVEKKLASPN